MNRRRFHFSVTQLLLLTAFVALLAGMLTASWRASQYRRLGALAFSPDGRYLVADYETGGVRLWDLSQNVPTSRRLSLPGESSRFLQGEPQFLTSARLVVFDYQFKPQPTLSVVQWDVANDRLVKSSELAPLQLYAAGVSHDRQEAVVVSYDQIQGAFQLWDINTGKPAATITAPSAVDAMAVAADGRRLVVDSRTAVAPTMEVWDLKTKKKIRSWSFSTPIYNVAISDDGRRVAVQLSSVRGRTEVWNVDSGQQESAFVGLRAYAFAQYRFSPDGALLVGADYDGAVQVWDVTSGKQKAELTLPRGNDFISQGVLAFSPDGQTMAVGNEDEIVLWDVETQRSRTLVKKRRVPAIVLFTLGLLVWGVVWGLVERRQLPRSPQATRTRAMPGRLPPAVEAALYPRRKLFRVVGYLAMVAGCAVILLAGPVTRMWGDRFSAYGLIFALIGLPLIMIAGSRIRDVIVHRLVGPLGNSLKLAEKVVGRPGRTVKHGSITACFFAESQIEPILQEEYQAALKQFWELIGEPFLPQRPLLVLVLNDRAAFEEYVHGSMRPAGIYWAAYERQIVICEQAALDSLTQPRRLLRRLLGSYFLHDYKGFVTQPWLQELVNQACDHDPSDPPRIHRGLRVWQRQGDQSVDPGLMAMSPREQYEVYFSTRHRDSVRLLFYHVRRTASMALYLKADPSGQMLERFRQFLNDLKPKDDYEAAFQRHFGHGYVQWLQQWNRWALTQEIEPIEPPPALILQHFVQHVASLIENPKAPIEKRAEAVRTVGAEVCLPAAGMLIDIVRAGRSNSLYRDALWALQTLSGEAHGDDLPRWETWWESLPDEAKQLPEALELEPGATQVIGEGPGAAVAEPVELPDDDAARPAARQRVQDMSVAANKFSPIRRQPKRRSLTYLRFGQILTAIAAVVAVVWSVAALFLFARDISPMAAVLVYGVIAGVYAVTRLVAGDLRRLRTATTMLMCCLIMCNVPTFLFAAFAKAFLQDSEVQELERTFKP